MARHDEFNKTRTDARESVENSPAPCKSPEDLLYSRDSLCAFKLNHAWPGRNYSLAGEAHQVDRRILDTISATRRVACINALLVLGRNNQNCVSVRDALTMPGFVSCLSRVEYAWLKKQPQSTLIGPSFNKDGSLRAESFAVWSYDETCKAATRSHRSFRGARNVASNRHES